MRVHHYLTATAALSAILFLVAVSPACNMTPVTPEGRIRKAVTQELDKQIKARMPVVDTFKFDSYFVLSSENVTLIWKVRQADNITIDNSLGAVEPAGSRQFVFPMSGKSTLTKYEYTLTASNKYGTVTNKAAVQVMDENQPPGIYFEVSSPQMHLGKGARLEWNVMFATEVSMDDGSGSPFACEASGEKIVNPLKTSTYTLTAVNKAGKSIKSRTLEVIPADD